MCSTVVWRLDAKCILVLSIFLDLLSVSLVVPSLPGRYRELGLTGWRFGAMGSVYSLMQIVGGVVLGVASDHALGRRGLLLVSFAGAALSYSMVAMASTLSTLVLSRIVVGLTKQSITAVSALMTEATADGAERTAWLAHITCATTLSWVVGSTLGGLLSTISPSMPEFVAVCLYGLNALLLMGALPSQAARKGAAEARVLEHAQPDVASVPPTEQQSAAATPPPTQPQRLRGTLRRVLRTFSFVLHNRAARRVLSVQLARVLVVKALASMSDMYESERWALSAVEIGLLRSYKSVAVLGVQVVLLPLLLSRSRQLPLHTLLHVATGAKVVVDLLEFMPSALLAPLAALPHLPQKLAAHPSLLVYMLLCVPVSAPTRPARPHARARLLCMHWHKLAARAPLSLLLTRLAPAPAIHRAAAHRLLCPPTSSCACLPSVRSGTGKGRMCQHDLRGAEVALYPERGAGGDGRGARGARRAAELRGCCRTAAWRRAAGGCARSLPAARCGSGQSAPGLAAAGVVPAELVAQDGAQSGRGLGCSQGGRQAAHRLSTRRARCAG
jgi:hypothetical protein